MLIYSSVLSCCSNSSGVSAMGGGATAKAAGWVRGRALRGAAAAALVLSLLALATRDYNSNGSRGLLASGLATRGDGSSDDGDIAGDYSESLLYHNRASRPHVHEHEMCSWETSQPVRGARVLRCRVLLQQLSRRREGMHCLSPTNTSCTLGRHPTICRSPLPTTK